MLFDLKINLLRARTKVLSSLILKLLMQKERHKKKRPKKKFTKNHLLFLFFGY